VIRRYNGLILCYMLMKVPAGGETNPVSSWLAPATAIDGDRGFVAALLSDSPLQTPLAWSVHIVAAELAAPHAEEQSSSCVPATPPETAAAAADSGSPAATSPDATVSAAQLLTANGHKCTPPRVRADANGAVAATPKSSATPASSGACCISAAN